MASWSGSPAPGPRAILRAMSFVSHVECTVCGHRHDPKRVLTVCERCGAVEDLDVRVPVASALDAARAAGFEASSASLAVVGLCSRCAREAR